MSVVISDSSPLICLCFLHQQRLLHQLFGKVYVPPSVASEILRPHPPLDGIIAENIPGIHVLPPTNIASIAHVSEGLHRGELEALALAVELHADLIIVDEAIGRRAAEILHVPIVGTLGVLSRAKEQHLISGVRPLIDRLRNDLGFFISQDVYEHVARLCGEWEK